MIRLTKRRVPQDLLLLPSYGEEAVARHYESCHRADATYLEAGRSEASAETPVLFAINNLTGEEPRRKADEPHL